VYTTKLRFYSNILADWCGQWNVTIDINQFSEIHHDILFTFEAAISTHAMGKTRGSDGY
jgi:hypothetical protein